MKKKTKKIETSLVRREGAVTNPYRANQWVADPRQQLFLAYYKDPKSPTFCNARQSALRAGFAENYADNILDQQPTWLMESLGGMSPLLAKAERNLEEFLELPNETQAIGMYGPMFQTIKKKIQDGNFKNGNPKFKTIKEKIPVMSLNPKVMKIKQDSSHFIAETIGKKKYSKRVGDTAPIFNIFMFAHEQRSRVAKRIVGGGSISGSNGARATD